MKSASKTRVAKIELIGAQAKPGPALAGLGINMSQLIKEFNDRTQDRNGEVVPVQLFISDKKFKFVCKSSPAAFLIKKFCTIEKGAADQKSQTVAEISRGSVENIAQQKLADSNSFSLEGMIKMIEGTARQMGVKITD